MRWVRRESLESPSNSVSISDLLKFGGKRSDQAAGGVRRRRRRRAPTRSCRRRRSRSSSARWRHARRRSSSTSARSSGTNVAFFGEQLGCKLFIEDLAADIDRHTRAGTRDALPETLSKRFPQGDGTVDGVLCWDIFDFLDRTPPRRWRARSCAFCGRAGRCSASSATRALRACAVHEVRDRRRRDPASSPHNAARAARNSCSRTATSSGCSTG